MPLNEKRRLMVDMDGTLAVFQRVDTIEKLYEKGYFKKLEPINHVLQAVKIISRFEPAIEVYILSAVLGDSKYALQEKNEWLDMHLPEIPKERRIFAPCGEDKKDYVPGGIRSTDYLLDDYTQNLVGWEPAGKGIKLLNGINHTCGTWAGSMISIAKPAEDIAMSISEVMSGKTIRDPKPGTRWKQQIMELEHGI